MAATPDSIAENLTPPGTPLDRLREAFARLSSQQKLLLMVAIAAIFALIVGTILWSKQPDYRVLFSNLSERDGGAIVTLLEQQNIPHRFTEGSGAILVPAARVHEVRLKLAQQGLPRGGSVGFELMENPKFGLSQFAEQVNYQRALEGELARTIQSIGAVQAARVHLAIPKPSVFVREEQKPTASVLLTLYPGRSLDEAQIAGITHLVSSSVPQLAAGKVAILDQSGALLTQLKNKLTEAGLDPTQVKYVREVEASIIKRISEILAPVLGEDNYKVQVAADIDFSQTEQTSESYKPNNTPDKSSIRSQQSNETASVATSTGGVPGALTNQPPVPATAPITVPAVGTTGTALPRPGEAPGRIDVAGVTAPLNAAGQPLNTSKNATTNYEVDKTIRYTKQSMGSIRRLTTAVAVNYRKDVGKDGKPLTRPLNENEMKQLNDLVREAMGFSQERGDSLSIANASFTISEKSEASLPIWKDPETQSLARDLIKYLLLAGIVAYIWFKIISPLLETMFPPPAPAEDATAAGSGAGGAGGLAGEGNEESILGEENVELNTYHSKLEKAREIAQSDSKAVANIIKDWMSGNGN